MATTVGSIITQIKAIAVAQLGVDWKENPNAYDLTQSDSRRGPKTYGVRPLAASNTSTVTNAYALNHSFELVLVDRVARKNDASQADTVIADLYDKQDEIFKDMVRAKLNLSPTVMLVSEPQLSEPEFINGQEFVALRQQFNVRYRQTI